ncbi:MAG: ion channel [Chitinophagaceae bacterium]
MRLRELINKHAINNTGFNVESEQSSGRLLNKDGSSNVKKSGISFVRRISLFHSLINMPFGTFMLSAILGFVFTNIVFAIVFYQIGLEQLNGHQTGNFLHDFFECFFFSVQTITTVGYGALHPQSFLTNCLASIESLFGWMAFAVLTGLLYGRFAKPTAYLMFSKHAIVAPYKKGKAIMFRLAPYKNNTLTEAEVLLNVAFRIHENDKVVNKFLPLETEISKISALSLNWTVVHYITESSPFYGMCEEDYSINNTEILVFIKAFDEHFSNVVQQRTSYTFDEIKHNMRFKTMFRQDHASKMTLLELDKMDEMESV